MPLPRDLPGRPDERVLRQFVAALLFERLVEPRVSGEGNLRSFEWSLGGIFYRCRANIGAFGRVRVLPRSIEMCSGNGIWTEAALRPMVEALPGRYAAKAQLSEELERTVELCSRNDANLLRVLRREMPFADIEGALNEGHPYHPCFKVRSGFSEHDHRSYGPEAANQFQLVWLAVARTHLHQALPGTEEEFWRAELGDDVWEVLSSRREEIGLDAASFALVPLHPWQWVRLKDGGLSELLKDGTVHFLGPVGDRYRASQSVRTLMNAVHAEKANVKLAMNMSNTSSLRTIEPHSVCTAPVISDWLAGIVAQDSLFRERYPLAILSEYAGIVVDRDGPLAGQLAAIWRENVSTVLCEGQSATPFNALMTVEHDGKPFIEPWVRRHGLSDWVERLIDVAVMPVWHLLVGHGIATEAHGQNMVLVHEDGWPARLVLRDFHDSLEFVPDFLRDTTSAPDFDALDPAYRSTAPDQYYWMTSVECLRALTMDSLFVYNLSEVSHLLEECYGLPEATFWKSVGDRLRRYAREHGLEGRQSLLKHDAPEILTESLLARKLGPCAEESFHKVPNMFAAAHQLCEA